MESSGDLEDSDDVLDYEPEEAGTDDDDEVGSEAMTKADGAWKISAV